jgi:hypothetical protein
MYRIAIITVLIFLSALLSLAQQESHQCESSIEYGNKNQIDPKPQSVRVVSGRVFDEVGDVGAPTNNPARELGAIPEACLGLFTEKGHRLVASVVADVEGRFKFKSVPPGKYRLVVRDPQNLLCVVNMPLRVVGWPRVGIFKRKSTTILVHMRAEGIDDCSYAEVK